MVAWLSAGGSKLTHHSTTHEAILMVCKPPPYQRYIPTPARPLRRPRLKKRNASARTNDASGTAPEHNAQQHTLPLRIAVVGRTAVATARPPGDQFITSRSKCVSKGTDTVGSRPPGEMPRTLDTRCKSERTNERANKRPCCRASSLPSRDDGVAERGQCVAVLRVR